MRPYMLWLTRVYGRSIVGYATAFQQWPNVLDDWLKRCAEDRWRNDRALQAAQRQRSYAHLHELRKNTSTGNPRRAADQLGGYRPSRAAGQGER